MGQDYLRTARAKGLPEHLVIGKHALRNAAIPVVTVIGLQVAGMVARCVLVETVFATKGVGDLVVFAAIGRDYPVLQFGVILIAALVVTVSLVVDLLYALIDPRVKVTASDRFRRPRIAPKAAPAAGAPPELPGCGRRRTRRPASISRCLPWCCWSTLFGPAAGAVRSQRPDAAGAAAPAGRASTGRCSDHPLGTDQLGRDMLSRTLHGLQLTMLIALVGSLISLVIGVTLGVVAGYAPRPTRQCHHGAGRHPDRRAVHADRASGDRPLRQFAAGADRGHRRVGLGSLCTDRAGAGAVGVAPALRRSGDRGRGLASAASSSSTCCPTSPRRSSWCGP